MDITIQLFKLLAGIGLFLFAMYLIEESLKNLSGRNFKIILQRISKNSLGAVIGGIIVTAVLQSSSLVSLMVLAFVGAGVLTMKNALAIILGANLGTTLASWLVATLGFKVNIEVVAYPAVCVGGLLLIMFSNQKRIKYISYLLLGFGVLFIGLSFMKLAMESQVQSFDFSKYAQMSLAAFLLIGFIITLLVQSSSVTMALTLSALHAGVITFTPAAALVLGSETGTTIKILLGALGGTVSKKRVAFGSFFFNISITILTFVFIEQILFLISDVLKINDPLIGLVSFSSLVNILCIVIYLPILNLFTKFLENLYKDGDETIAAFIGHANAGETETALDLFRRETEYFVHNSILFNLEQFQIDTKSFQGNRNFKSINEKRKFFSKSQKEKYEFLKQLQGELQSFYIILRKGTEGEQNTKLNQLISSVRSSMHAVKSIKDIDSNISNLRRSSKDIKFNFFMHHKKETQVLYENLYSLMSLEKKASYQILQKTFYEIQNNYSSALADFYKDAQSGLVEDLDITTALNFNRELFTSNKAMLIAVKDFLLDEKEAEAFNELSVYRT